MNARLLAEDELALAPPLLQPEGWDFEQAELARLRRLGGAVGAFDGTTLVGFLTFVEHPPIRWIGNVVVSPGARGAGVGARIVQVALDGATSAGLYSVEPAITLYERLGFAPAGQAFAFHAKDARPGPGGRSDDLRASDLPEIVRMDAEATGMDRRALLHELLRAYPRTFRVVREGGRVTGYGVAKTSEQLTELGPVVATTERARDALLDDLLGDTPGPHEATTMDEGTMEALLERGFDRRFRTVAMFRGPAPTWHPERLCAAAGLEKS